jgi:hypothetical protein
MPSLTYFIFMPSLTYFIFMPSLTYFIFTLKDLTRLGSCPSDVLQRFTTGDMYHSIRCSSNSNDSHRPSLCSLLTYFFHQNFTNLPTLNFYRNYVDHKKTPQNSFLHPQSSCLPEVEPSSHPLLKPSLHRQNCFQARNHSAYGAKGFRLENKL